MKTLSITSLFLAAFPLVAIACSSGDFAVGSDQSASEGDPGLDGGACVTDTDCGSGKYCGFANADACTATGRCFAFSGAECNAVSPGCACDGTEVNLICGPLPSGYSSKPLLHTGACGSSGAQDASTGAPCNQNSDCAGTQQLCGFLQSQACAAQGVCVPSNEGAICNAIELACACDGTNINIGCTQYPEGYVVKPFAHTGACDDAGK